MLREIHEGVWGSHSGARTIAAKGHMKEHCMSVRVPHTIITGNGRQFSDRGLQSFYEDLGIKSITSSVEHALTNRQAKATNKVILN